MTIYWTSRATVNFDNLVAYLAQEWGDKVTSRFVRNVFEFLELLSEFPELGSVEVSEKGIRGFTLSRQVKIFYRINSDRIIVLGFFDNRKNPSKKRL